MKTVIKILLVCGVVALLVWGGMYYAKTISDPPEIQRSRNLYTASVDEAMEELLRCEPVAKGGAFDNLVCRLDVFTSQGLIDSVARNDYFKHAVQEYVPVFSSLCYSKFNNTGWNWEQSQLDKMRQRAGYLNRLRARESETVWPRRLQDSVQRILTVLDDHKNARNLILEWRGQYTYNRIRMSGLKRDIRTYQNNRLICNDVNIRNGLRDLVGNVIGNTFYNLETEARKLANYPSMSEQDWNEQYSLVQRNMTDYYNVYVEANSVNPVDREPRFRALRDSVSARERRAHTHFALLNRDE